MKTTSNLFHHVSTKSYDLHCVLGIQSVDKISVLFLTRKEAGMNSVAYATNKN